MVLALDSQARTRGGREGIYGGVNVPELVEGIEGSAWGNDP